VQPFRRSRLPASPQPGVVAQGFEVSPVSTIWVKVRAGLSDILHHAVGEMPGRAEGVSCQRGFVGTVDLGYGRLPGNLPLPPCFVAGSSRPPADASGGQEKRAVSHQKPWIEAEGEERKRAPSADLLGPASLLVVRTGRVSSGRRADRSQSRDLRPIGMGWDPDPAGRRSACRRVHRCSWRYRWAC